MSKRSPKILGIDIETAPHTAYVWGLFQETVPIQRLIDTGRTLCFAWKWINEPGNVSFIDERAGRGILLDRAHELLNEADIVVTYNGKKFDLPTLNKEFLEGGYSPPAPYKQVDLYQTAKREFRFASNKMDHLAKELGIRTKVKHNGFELWVRCMEGDSAAWKTMERYNKRDVLILDKLYHRLLPWIRNHPNAALYDDDGELNVCPSCASTKLEKRGLAKTTTYTYQRFQCKSCGRWSRSRSRDKASPTPKVVGYA